MSAKRDHLRELNEKDIRKLQMTLNAKMEEKERYERQIDLMIAS